MKYLMNFSIWVLCLLFVGVPCKAQDCATFVVPVPKGTTVTATCDSLILVSKSLVRSAVTAERQNTRFERAKFDAVRRLEIDKDRAVSELVTAFNAQITAKQKLFELADKRNNDLESKYLTLLESTNIYLEQSKVHTEAVRNTMRQIEYDVSEFRKEYVDLQSELRRVSRRNLFVGLGIGIGAGAGIAALIVLAK